MRGRAAKSDFLATLFHIMKFSKDIVLKLDARISHKQDAFFFSQMFLCESNSDLGHQSFTCDRGLRWATLRTIRRFFKQN